MKGQDGVGVICSHRCPQASLVPIDLELDPFTLTLAVTAHPLSVLINLIETSCCQSSTVTLHGATAADLSCNSALALFALSLQCSKSKTIHSHFCTGAAAAPTLF